jgi:uncharacterized lipoprotein NlpE involved in copper resistance
MESTNKGEEMKKGIVGLAIGALTLAGCSSSDSQSATQVSSSAQTQVSKAAAAHAVAVAKASQEARARAAAKAKAAGKAKAAKKAKAHYTCDPTENTCADGTYNPADSPYPKDNPQGKPKVKDLCAHSYMGRAACHRAFPDGLVPEMVQAPTDPAITGCNPYYMYCGG